MCGEIFWKGAVVFCLTFGLGVLVSGAFGSKTVPVQIAVKPVAEYQSPAAENCRPVDKDLKYQKIPLKNDSRSVEKSAPVSPPRLSEKKSEPKKPVEQAKKQAETAGPEFYDPSEDPAELKKLLHEEQCFETQKPN